MCVMCKYTHVCVYLSMYVCVKLKKKSQAHYYSCPEEGSCNVWICTLSVSSTIGGTLL